MSNSVKERISDDLKRAKAEGSLRTERIRDIVRAAVSQAVDELKAGSGEVRVIAKDAIAAVMENLGGKTEDTKEYISASVEGTIEGIQESKREAITSAQVTVDRLQAQIVDEEEQLESDVDSALVAIETENGHESNGFKSLVDDAVRSIRERKGFAYLEQQYVKLKEQLEQLDNKLAARYGGNYDQVKQRLEKAKTWYDAERVKLETGETDRVQKTQARLENSFSEAGTSLAHQEQRVKRRVKEFLQTTLNKLQ
ncbi:MAG: hypothetical protein Kow00121_22150 [Elainellaceae cyanobacterium]